MVFQGARQPDFVVATEMGVVIYEERKAIGLQFVDPAGKQAFLWIPGKLLSAIGESISEAVAVRPEVLDWNPPPLNRETH